MAKSPDDSTINNVEGDYTRTANRDMSPAVDAAMMAQKEIEERRKLDEERREADIRCLEALAPKPQVVVTDDGLEVGVPISSEPPSDCN